ncbi:MAG: Glutamate racemase [Parcubacteria group bacterium]|nr:Glutamate racemase [Parcubacteria group bacterium]
MTQARKYSIGVFDSGFGGLAILKDIHARMPDYSYVYLGDTARTPYGSRSSEVVYQFTLQAIEKLFSQGCGLIIIACNTASAEALRKIQQEYLPTHYPDRRVLGVIIPAAEEAIHLTRNGRIGVLATEGTVRSETFSKELKKLNPKVQVFQQAAPLLVPFVEEGAHRSEAAQLVVASYLRPLLKHRIDTLILGCTHYGHLESLIKKEIGPGVRVLSEGKVVAKKLENYLARHPEIEKTLKCTGGLTFYTTDLTEKFKTVGSALFGRPLTPKSITLG